MLSISSGYLEKSAVQTGKNQNFVEICYVAFDALSGNSRKSLDIHCSTFQGVENVYPSFRYNKCKVEKWPKIVRKRSESCKTFPSLIWIYLDLGSLNFPALFCSSSLITNQTGHKGKKRPKILRKWQVIHTKPLFAELVFSCRRQGA